MRSETAFLLQTLYFLFVKSLSSLSGLTTCRCLCTQESWRASKYLAFSPLKNTPLVDQKTELETIWPHIGFYQDILIYDQVLDYKVCFAFDFGIVLYSVDRYVYNKKFHLYRSSKPKSVLLCLFCFSFYQQIENFVILVDRCNILNIALFCIILVKVLSPALTNFTFPLSMVTSQLKKAVITF